MADNRKMVALENTLNKAFSQWTELFNKLNTDIAYAVKSPEDNPKGNLRDDQWDRYLEAIKEVRSCFSTLGQAVFYLSNLQKNAKPIYGIGGRDPR